MKKIFLFVILALLVLPNGSFAKKGAGSQEAGTDDDHDRYGNTCPSNGKCTFTRKEILPGGIPAEVQAISLGGFKVPVDAVFDYAFGDVRRVASLLNPDDPNSEISKVNANAGIGFVEVGPEFIQIINAAKKVFLWTDGAFDITTTPEIGNFNHIKITNNMIYLKKKGMKISFAHIIDGYIADLLIRAIYNANLDNAIAEVGSSTRSMGMSVVGNWRTSVDDADGRFARRGMTIDTSNVSVGSVAYGRNAPTIDPRWKTSITPLCRSVTTISRNALIAKAIAYGVYVLGPEKGMQVLVTLQTVKGIIVDNGGNFLKTPGI